MSREARRKLILGATTVAVLLAVPLVPSLRRYFRMKRM
jgi:hypothetical protein